MRCSGAAGGWSRRQCSHGCSWFPGGRLLPGLEQRRMGMSLFRRLGKPDVSTKPLRPVHVVAVGQPAA